MPPFAGLLGVPLEFETFLIGAASRFLCWPNSSANRKLADLSSVTNSARLTSSSLLARVKRLIHEILADGIAPKPDSQPSVSGSHRPTQLAPERAVATVAEVPRGFNCNGCCGCWDSGPLDSPATPSNDELLGLQALDAIDVRAVAIRRAASGLRVVVLSTRNAVKPFDRGHLWSGSAVVRS